jgi:hypothetical protein
MNMHNNKITKLYQAFLSLKNLRAGNDTFDLFMSACKDYNFLCTLEKMIAE